MRYVYVHSGRFRAWDKIVTTFHIHAPICPLTDISFNLLSIRVCSQETLSHETVKRGVFAFVVQVKAAALLCSLSRMFADLNLLETSHRPLRFAFVLIGTTCSSNQRHSLFTLLIP